MFFFVLQLLPAANIKFVFFGMSDSEGEKDVNYRVPKNRTLEEIKKLDEGDESLRKYKERLLGPSFSPEDIPCMWVL